MKCYNKWSQHLGPSRTVRRQHLWLETHTCVRFPQRPLRKTGGPVRSGHRADGEEIKQQVHRSDFLVSRVLGLTLRDMMEGTVGGTARVPAQALAPHCQRASWVLGHPNLAHDKGGVCGISGQTRKLECQHE